MSRLICLVLALLLATIMTSARQAHAGYVSGWDLLEVCKAAPATPTWRVKTGQCFGYVIGVADTFDCKEQLHGFSWNSSTPTPQQDVVKKVVAWLVDHPGTLNHESDGLIAAALHESFPCN